MSRPLFWLGIPTTTTAYVVVRSLTTGTVTVNCNGSDFTGSADTSVQDGLVKIPITGLSADTTYPYTVTNPNTDTGSSTLKTFPASGDVKIAYYSCNNGGFDAGFLRILAESPHCVVCLGDLGYFAGGTPWGADYSNASLDGGSNIVSDYHQAQRAYRARSYFRKMCEQIPFAYVPDDHEWDVNNVNWTSLSADLDIIAAFTEGTSDYLIGNPVNGDSPGDANPFYFRFECGDTEVFVLSNTIHGIDATDVQHMLRDAPGADASCLGRDAAGTDIRNQENWLIAKLASSTKKYKVILNPKMTLYSTQTNADSFGKYSTEMNRLLQSIHDNSPGWAVPGGVIWGCGDWHSPGIHASENGVGTGTFDHVAVTACPMNNAIRDAGAASEWTVYHYAGTDNIDNVLEYEGIYGMMETSALQITGKIKNWPGNILAQISVDAGAA